MPGTEKYYKYLVQYRVRDSADWQEVLPLIDHPDNITTSRSLLNHTIGNLTKGIEYEVQIALCRVWYGVRGECAVAPDPVITVRTGE